MSRVTDGLQEAARAEAAKYRGEVTAWQERVSALVARVVERDREATALEREQAEIIRLLVDAPEGSQQRQDLIFQWQTMRDQREIALLEHKELSKRLASLRAQPPHPVSTNGSMPSGKW